jgi:hypothetical protein
MAAPVWLEPAPLRLDGLGPGLTPERLRAALQALADDPATKALVLFCSRWHVLGRIAREGKVLYAS